MIRNTTIRAFKNSILGLTFLTITMIKNRMSNKMSPFIIYHSILTTTLFTICSFQMLAIKTANITILFILSPYAELCCKVWK